MEKDLNFIENPRISQFDLKMEDIIKYLKNGPHFFIKKTTLFFSNGRQLNKIMYPKTIKVKIMVVAPLRVT